MSNGNDIDYSAAIDAALREAAANEASMVTELDEPDPAAVQETPVQDAPDIGQYFTELPEETGQEISDQEIRAPEGSEQGTAAEEEPLSIEERLDDITEIVQGTQDLLKSLIGIMEKQGTSIDSIGSRVIGAVQTVMSHAGVKPPPTAPAAAAAVVEGTQEANQSDAEKQNLETITKLKERRS